MQKITHSKEETQKLAEDFVKTLKGGEVLCLTGDLGAGKTTFTQGLLKALGAKGPYTSPTFVIMKKYEINKLKTESSKLKAVYHIDAYRVESRDVLNLGWNEMISDPQNIVIVEWAERIKDILPKKAIQLQFEWVSENERKIEIGGNL